MNALRKSWLAGSALVLLAVALLWLFQARDKQGAPNESRPRAAAAAALASANPATDDRPKLADAEPSVEAVKEPVATAALSAEEQHKEIDRQHMRLLHSAIFEYKKVHGHFPEYLSQLAPDFVDESALHSPRRKKEGMAIQLLGDHVDPGNAKPSYAFEFSNLVFRDGRTFWEIKEVQRAEWGDAIPLLRTFGHDKVMNMSYGGDLYETELNWEWDPATLDVVAERGWGPGLDDGKFTTVQVLGASGQPLPNAQVWADGRNYSFDLPNRPFVTDANGFARIPLGADLDRTELVLRFEGYGMASPAVVFPRGEPPESYVLKANLARAVGGKVVDSNGEPVAGTWVYLSRPGVGEDGAPPEKPGASLGVVKTDANGRWTASLHPSDAAGFHLTVPSGPRPPKFSAGQPVDAYAAAAGHAVTTIEAPPRLQLPLRGNGE